MKLSKWKIIKTPKYIDMPVTSRNDVDFCTTCMTPAYLREMADAMEERQIDRIDINVEGYDYSTEVSYFRLETQSEVDLRVKSLLQAEKDRKQKLKIEAEIKTQEELKELERLKKNMKAQIVIPNGYRRFHGMLKNEDCVLAYEIGKLTWIELYFSRSPYHTDDGGGIYIRKIKNAKSA